MNKLLSTLILLLFAYAANAQVYQEDTSRYMKNPNAYPSQLKGFWATSIMRIPDTTNNRPQQGVPGAIGRNPAGTQLYTWDGTQWVTGSGGVTIDSVFLTTIDSIFITQTDSIFIISGNDTIFIGESDQPRDTARLTFGYGLVGFNNDYYNPNAEDEVIILDTSLLSEIVGDIIINDTTIYFDSADVTYFVDSIISEPFAAGEGSKFLISATPSGLFVGHENEIVTRVGGSWTYQVPSSGDIVLVTNPISSYYKYNGAEWLLIRRVVSVGGDRIGATEDIGNLSNADLNLITNSTRQLTITDSGKIKIRDFIGVDTSNNFVKVVDEATGELGTGTFRQLIAGDNITITAGENNTDTISATGGGGDGTTTNALTMNNSGTGDASGTTFNGSAAKTISSNTILPAQTGNSGKYLQTDGSNVSWQTPAGSGTLSNVYAPLVKSGDTIHQRYNVLHYGADNTGTNDATTAIQNAINDAAAAGGGEVFFPRGTYIIDGAYKTTDGNGHDVDTAQLYAPFSPYDNTAPLLSIKLMGEVHPNNYANFSDAINKPTTGVILKSTRAGVGKIIGTAYDNVRWGDFSYTNFQIENITVRARSKTSGGVDTAVVQTAIDASKMSMFGLTNVRVDVESLDTLEVEPASTAYGVKMPSAFNFTEDYLNNVIISGFYTGLTVSEHVTGVDVQVNNSINGLEVLYGFHNSHFDQLKLWWNKYNILISARSSVSIDALSLEDYLGNGSGYQAPRFWNFKADIKEPDSTGSLLTITNYNRIISGFDIANNGFVDSSRSANINYVSVDGYGKVKPITPLVNGTQTVKINNTSSQPLFQFGNFTGFNTSATLWMGNVTPSTTNWVLNSAGAATLFNTTLGGSFDWRFNNASSPSAMLLNSTGLGIGVAPTQKLTVAGSISASGNISADNGNVGATASPTYLDLGSNFGNASAGSTTNLKLRLGNGNGVGVSGAGGLELLSSSGNPVSLSPGGSPALWVLNGGNVAIGQTSSSYKLAVNGTTNFIGNSLFGTTASTSTATPLNVSFGGTYGSNAAFSTSNLKWKLYEDGTAANTYGIGMTSGLMDIHAGSSAGIALSTNNGTQALRAFSSGSVNIGTSTTEAASAALNIVSTTKGFLPPRMTATQASAISSPAEGLLVYVTDTNGTFTAKGWWGWSGAAWEKLNN